MTSRSLRWPLVLVAALSVGCFADTRGRDSGAGVRDAGRLDAGVRDAAIRDAAIGDAGASDAAP